MLANGPMLFAQATRIINNMNKNYISQWCEKNFNESEVHETFSRIKIIRSLQDLVQHIGSALCECGRQQKHTNGRTASVSVSLCWTTFWDSQIPFPRASTTLCEVDALLDLHPFLYIPTFPSILIHRCGIPKFIFSWLFTKYLVWFSLCYGA